MEKETKELAIVGAVVIVAGVCFAIFHSRANAVAAANATPDYGQVDLSGNYPIAITGPQLSTPQVALSVSMPNDSQGTALSAADFQKELNTILGAGNTPVPGTAASSVALGPGATTGGAVRPAGSSAGSVAATPYNGGIGTIQGKTFGGVTRVM